MIDELELGNKRIRTTTTVKASILKWCKENGVSLSRLIEIGFREFQKIKLENQHIRELYDKIGKLEKRVSFLERKLLYENNDYGTDK